MLAFQSDIRAAVRSGWGVPTATPTATPAFALAPEVCVYSPDGVLVPTGIPLSQSEGMVICILSGGVYVEFAPPGTGEAGPGGATPVPYWETER